MPQRRDTLKNPEQELRIFRVRALLAVLVVIVLTSLLVGRLGYLQIVQHDLYSTRSEKNRVRVEPLPPNRGLIYDRNGVLLAENRPTYNLTLVRERVDDLDDTLALLVGLLELPEEEIEAFQVRSRQRQRPFQPALLMSDLSEEQIARLAVNRHLLHKSFNTIYTARAPRRTGYASSLCRLTAGLSTIVTVCCWRKTVLPTT